MVEKIIAFFKTIFITIGLFFKMIFGKVKAFFIMVKNGFLKGFKAVLSFIKRKKKTSIFIGLGLILLTLIIVFLCILFAERIDPDSTTTIPVNGINIIEEDNVIYELDYIGEKYKLEYEVLPVNAHNKKVKWTSSNEKIVSVSQDGVLELVSFQTEDGEDILITVETIDGGYKDSVYVVVPVDKKYSERIDTYLSDYEVIINEENKKLFKGVTLVLSDKIYIPSIIDELNITEDSFEFVWKESNNEVVNIDCDITTGETNITCLATGTTTLTFECLDMQGSVIVSKSFDIEVLLEDVYEVAYSGLKDEYFQGEIINNNLVVLDIKYRNSRGDKLQKTIEYGKLFPNDELTTFEAGYITKEVKYQNYEFKIEYIVKEAELTSFNVLGLSENYTVYPNINASIEITLNNDITLTYSIYQMNSNINEIDFGTFGKKELVIDYFNNKYTYEFNIINKEVIEKNVSGLLLEYPLNSVINYNDIMVSIKYNQEYNLTDCYYSDINGSLAELVDINELNRLFDNSTVGKKKVEIVIGEYQDVVEFEYNVVNAIVNVEELNFIIPIKEEYYLNEEFLLNVEAVYNGYTLNTSVYNNLQIYLNGSLVDSSDVTKNTGDYKLKFVFGNIIKEFDIKVISFYEVNFFDEEGELISKVNNFVQAYSEVEVSLFNYTGYEYNYLETDYDVLYSVVNGKLFFTSFEKNQNIVINVYYKKSTYNIIYNITNYPVHIESYKYQDEIKEYVPTLLDGYIFTGWDKEIPTKMPGYDIIVYGSYITEASGLYSIKFYLEDFEGNYKLQEIEKCIILSGIGASFVVEYDNVINIKVIDANNNIQKQIVREYTGYDYLRYEIVENECNVYFSIKSYKITYNYGDESHVVNYKYNQKIEEFNPIKYGYTLSWDNNIPSYMPEEDIVVNGTYTANTYKVTLINGEEYIYYLYKCDEKLDLPILSDEVNEFLGWADDDGIVYENMVWYDLILKPLWKEYLKVVSYEVNGLESNYLTNSVIDLENISVTFTLESEDVKTLKLNDILINGDFDTSTIGTKEIKFKYENQVFIIYYEVSDVLREIVSVEIENFPSYFYENDDVSLSDYSLKIVYTNSVVTIPLTSSKVNVSGFDLQSIGTKALIITYYSEVVVIPYEVINPIHIVNDTVLILSNEYSFYVNIDEKSLMDGYILTFSESSEYSVSVEEKNNGIYYVTVKLTEGVNEVNLNISIDGIPCSEVVNINRIDLDDLDIVIEGKGYGFINKNFTLSVSIYYEGVKYSMNGLTYEWTSDSEVVISGKDGYCQILSVNPGVISVSVVVMIEGKSATVSRNIEIINPYEGIRFTDNRDYGIGEALTLGGFRYKNNTELVSKVYTFNVISKTSVDSSKLTWYTSDESIASFGLNGELNIHGDGYVTLYVTSSDAYKFGLSSSTYVGSFTVKCVYDAVYVTTYDELSMAFKNNNQVVLGNSIDVGAKVMDLVTDSNGNVIRNKVSGVNVNQLVNSSIGQIESTWECDFLTNISNNPNFKAKVNYCLEITNNLYGNGYTLDCYQITTASSVDSSVKAFNGPLEFISLLDAACVYGQDNIGFVIRDNVTVDNVILQNCDDGYLYQDGLYVYSKLENVGTTVEVMGNNVNIINSRIRNGRNNLRIYGSSNPDEKINVRIESTIIANAREFLVKIGANKSIDANCEITYNGEKTYVRDLYDKHGLSTKEVSNYVKSDSKVYNELFESCSPSLLKEDGTKYKAFDNSNQLDEYFVSHYVKTDVTMKNCVLTNTGFYAIGLESKFSGPILGGYRYAPKDIEISDYPGAYNLSGTSFSAILRLEGDVRIYNWKKLSEIDSSSIMERLENADMIENMGFEFTFKVNELIKNISSEEGYEKIISNVSGDEYAHGGIAFYGGGKNYHMINLDNYSGYSFTRYSIPFSSFGDGLFSQTLPWAAGREPFVFYMYDSDSEFSYNYQTNQIETGNAYSWIEPVK